MRGELSADHFRAVSALQETESCSFRHFVAEKLPQASAECEVQRLPHVGILFAYHYAQRAGLSGRFRGNRSAGPVSQEPLGKADPPLVVSRLELTQACSLEGVRLFSLC